MFLALLMPLVVGVVRASASVTGLDVVYEGVVEGRYVYSVYVVSSNPSNVLVSVYRHTVVTGSMSGVQHSDIAGGSWSPLFTSASAATFDSFVTMTGVSGASSATQLDPGFGAGTGSTIPANAGWYSSTPTSLPVFGASGRIKVLQVAGASLTSFQGRLKVSYKSSASSPTMP